MATADDDWQRLDDESKDLYNSVRKLCTNVNVADGGSGHDAESLEWLEMLFALDPDVFAERVDVLGYMSHVEGCATVSEIMRKSVPPDATAAQQVRKLAGLIEANAAQLARSAGSYGRYMRFVADLARGVRPSHGNEHGRFVVSALLDEPNASKQRKTTKKVLMAIRKLEHASTNDDDEKKLVSYVLEAYSATRAVMHAARGMDADAVGTIQEPACLAAAILCIEDDAWLAKLATKLRRS